MTIDFNSQPPESVGVRIHSPKDGDKMLLLGHSVGVWVHWTGRRTAPCLGEESCPRTRHKQPVRWCAYYDVAVVERPYAKPATLAILSVTPTKHRQIQELSEVETEGTHLELTIARRNASREWAIESARGLTPAEVPKSFDVAAELRRIWGVRE